MNGVRSLSGGVCRGGLRSVQFRGRCRRAKGGVFAFALTTPIYEDLTLGHGFELHLPHRFLTFYADLTK
jgi:hypothetical protein